MASWAADPRVNPHLLVFETPPRPEPPPPPPPPPSLLSPGATCTCRVGPEYCQRCGVCVCVCFEQPRFRACSWPTCQSSPRSRARFRCTRAGAGQSSSRRPSLSSFSRLWCRPASPRRRRAASRSARSGTPCSKLGLPRQLPCFSGGRPYSWRGTAAWATAPRSAPAAAAHGRREGAYSSGLGPSWSSAPHTANSGGSSLTSLASWSPLLSGRRRAHRS
mmetsp:Transcript_43260/g.97776  ORF Transcript_43260/g.97776 Transcript_43260/m.97776 type:complete len:219 (+) Transcript_43260:589-1245(+)